MRKLMKVCLTVVRAVESGTNLLPYVQSVRWHPPLLIDVKM